MTQFTEQQLKDMEKAFAQFCEAHGIIPNQQNTEFVASYFLDTWKQPMTPENLEKAFPHLEPHLTFYEQHQKEFAELYAGLSEHERNEFNAWQCPTLKTTNRNATVLLGWLRDHGFQVSRQNLQLAVGQQRLAALLEFLPLRRQVDPRQHKSDNGEPFLGRDVNLPAWKRRQQEREAREKDNTTSTPAKEMTAWQRIAHGLLGSCRSHAQNESLQRIYTRGESGMEWREVAREMQLAKNQFNNLVSTARF